MTFPLPSIFRPLSTSGSRIAQRVCRIVGAGVRPVSLDQRRLVRLKRWCGAPDPRVALTAAEKEKPAAKTKERPLPRDDEMPFPGFLFGIDPERAGPEREIYSQKCAYCRAWPGDELGKITPVGGVQTDPFRNASFSHEPATNFSKTALDQWWAFFH